MQPGPSKLSPELSELVVYTCSVPFRGFEQAAARPAAEMSSFSESKALRLIRDSGKREREGLWASTGLGSGGTAWSPDVCGGLCCFLALQGPSLSVTTVRS